jgi:predicted signal transduction protein with EAL and GGDEF domain
MRRLPLSVDTPQSRESGHGLRTGASKASAALINTFVQLGQALDMETLAEGIEDQADLETLKPHTAITDRGSCSRAHFPPVRSRSSSMPNRRPGR